MLSRIQKKNGKKENYFSAFVVVYIYLYLIYLFLNQREGMFSFNTGFKYSVQITLVCLDWMNIG